MKTSVFFLSLSIISICSMFLKRSINCFDLFLIFSEKYLYFFVQFNSHVIVRHMSYNIQQFFLLLFIIRHLNNEMLQAYIFIYFDCLSFLFVFFGTLDFFSNRIQNNVFFFGCHFLFFFFSQQNTQIEHCFFFLYFLVSLKNFHLQFAK